MTIEFNVLAGVLSALIGIGVAFGIARQDRPIGKKHFDKLIKEKEELGEEFGVLEREQRAHNRRQEELAGLVQRQRADYDQRIDELAQKLRDLEAEIAALKRPAT